jgi:hypothetical protein
VARVFAILKAVSKSFTRGRKSLGASVANHFLVSVAYLLQVAGAFIFAIVAVLLLFPLSADPLRTVPADRLKLWPLTVGEHRALRALAPWLNWMTWVVAGLAIWAMRGTISYGLLAAGSAIFLAGFLLPSYVGTPSGLLLLYVPGIPGPLRELTRKNLRQILCRLDVYLALLIVVSTSIYRVWGSERLPEQALLMLSLLVVLVFSSHASGLFDSDGDGGMTRYRLLPVRGWQVLLAKDAALFLVVLVLTLPMAPLPALSGVLAMTAVGHGSSVMMRRPLARWRFSVGAPILMYGVIQLVAISMAAAGTVYGGLYVMGLAALAYIASLLTMGYQFER